MDSTEKSMDNSYACQIVETSPHWAALVQHDPIISSSHLRVVLFFQGKSFPSACWCFLKQST